MYTPPGIPRSRSFTRLTMRVGLLHLGQSVDFVVSITFLRSPVFAIFAMGKVFLLLGLSLHTRAGNGTRLQRRGPRLALELASLHQEGGCQEGSKTRSSQFTTPRGFAPKAPATADGRAAIETP